MSSETEYEPAALDAKPDLEDVLQEEDAPVAVPVKHDGPVHTQELPARRWSAFNTTVVDTSVEHLFGRDPRRKRVTLMTTDAPYIVGESKQVVEKGAGAVWPQNVALVLAHQGDIYVRRSAAGSSVLSVVAEYWAD